MYVPPKGDPQLQIKFDGVEAIRRRVPADEHSPVKKALRALYDDDQLESLRAYQDGSLSTKELLVAQKKERLTDEYLLARIKLARLLWTSMEAAIEELGDSEETRDRYRFSLAKLKKHAKLGNHPRVRALKNVKWKQLRRRWPGKDGKPPCSAADWNRLRQMVGATLTVITGDVYHPFRRAVMKQIPRLKEKPRVVELSVDEFWALVRELPEQARPGVVTMAATGFRLGEYLACGKEHLHAATCAVENPSGKTGEDVVHVAEWLWPWVEAGIPAPIKERWLGIHFRRARKKIGKSTLWLEDIRHVFGQLAADEGVSIDKIQAAMRHESISMTSRYLKRSAKREVAEAVGRQLRGRGRRHA